MNLWREISYLGVSENENNVNKRTYLLTNRLIILTVTSILGYVPILYFLDITAPISLSIAFSILFVILYLLAKSGKRELTLALLLAIMVFYIISLSTIEEIMGTKLVNGTIQIFLIVISLVAITLFKRIYSGLLFSVATLLIFLAMEWIKSSNVYQIESPTTAHWILYFINVFTIFFAISYCFYHFKLISKDYRTDLKEQRRKLSIQHNKLELAYFEVQKSIEYAKKIQSAILPSHKLVKEYFKESFIFYRPKDIVAGDFYWTQQIDGYILFAVADCTGHGVPGALVSMVCNNALNRVVREYGCTDTGLILDKTRDIVVHEFEKSEDHVYDGMDIAIVKMPLDMHDQDNVTIEFSGANNPLWIVRNNEIIEYKGCKQPVAKFHKTLPFITHTITLEKNDHLFIFSDGIIDQFGGEKGKKFKLPQFRSLLIKTSNTPSEDKLNFIENVFLNWMGTQEQVDDVCLIGVKI
ncbi:MAG: SpoIIE family protein phosphatase [Putridiphycobacter sp.]|nr:SpoIIE family protein phosphatase [Putridiphycobacter sp.]